MPNPVKAAKGIASLFDKTEKAMKAGKTAQFVGKSRSEAGFARKKSPVSRNEWDRAEQVYLMDTDLPIGKRGMKQQAAQTLLADAIQASRPKIASSTANMYASKLMNDLRRELQLAIEYERKGDLRNAQKNRNYAKQTNARITAMMREGFPYVRRNPYIEKLAATAALSKMAEATMMPEPSFGEKTGEFLMDWLQPLPRSWGKADPKMRVD